MKILSDIPPSSRYVLLFHPMFAIFNSMLTFYMPLYMRGNGLSEVEMGLVNSANMLFAFILFFFSSPMANKYGRKKTTFIFDTVSWGVPMFIWAFSHNFWYFLAAGIINAATRVVSTPWNCLLIEDVKEHKRAWVFNVMSLIGTVAGMLTPIAGLLISKFGVVPPMRILYFIGALCTITAFVLRYKFGDETEAGRKMMEQYKNVPLMHGVTKYIKSMAYIFKSRDILLLSLITIIIQYTVSINFYQIVFLKEHLMFNEKVISLMPLIGGVINVVLYAFIITKLEHRFRNKSLPYSLVVYALGAVAFLMIPKGNFAVMLTVTALLSTGSMLVQSYSKTVLLNRLDDKERADVFAGVQAIVSLVAIPAGYIGGFFYSVSPILPFIIILALIISALVLSLLLRIIYKPAEAMDIEA